MIKTRGLNWPLSIGVTMNDLIIDKIKQLLTRLDSNDAPDEILRITQAILNLQQIQSQLVE